MKSLLKNKELILIPLLLIAGFLRAYNVNWDQGNFFHPDERNIAAAVSRIHFFDQLNPQFFAYGGFSFYLYRAFGELLVKLTHNPAWVYDWGHINIISRCFSAFFSTFTLIPLFFLTKKLFNKETALLAGIFYTFTVSSIQTAHLGITENLLTLTVVLLCLLSLELLKNPKFNNYFKSGAVLGIAVATKTTALSFSIFPFIAHLLVFIKNPRNFLKIYAFLFLFLLTALLVFTLFSPYTFLSWNKFMESLHYESGVATGSLPVPYTLQFSKTIPYLFQIKNLFWQIGPVFLFSLFGFLTLTFRLLTKREAEIFVFLSFPVIYFAYVGSWHTKFIRFMVPLLPFFIIYLSYFLFLLKTRFKLLGTFLIILSVIITSIWALAFFSIYTREQTRISASKWIYQNVPAQSKILTEHWDDGLPVSVPSFSPVTYQIEQLAIYDPDNPQKIQYYAGKLSTADYIIINSRRLYGTLFYLPEKYPLTSRYYQLLFNESLGYEKVAEFTSYPALFGFEINDDASEETFQVYEHPKVIIFKNTDHFSLTKLSNILRD